jgi:hypothetical protein
MGQSRRLSRPSHPRAFGRLVASRQRHAPRVARPKDGSASERSRIDPGRLIEDAFRNPFPRDAPETYVLAWFALLEEPAEAPLAAAKLIMHLLRNRSGDLSFWQARLIELLAFVAQHTRSPTRGDAQRFQLSPKKGQS